MDARKRRKGSSRGRSERPSARRQAGSAVIGLNLGFCPRFGFLSDHMINAIVSFLVSLSLVSAPLTIYLTRSPLLAAAMATLTLNTLPPWALALVLASPVLSLDDLGRVACASKRFCAAVANSPLPQFESVRVIGTELGYDDSDDVFKARAPLITFCGSCTGRAAVCFAITLTRWLANVGPRSRPAALQLSALHPPPVV